VSRTAPSHPAAAPAAAPGAAASPADHAAAGSPAQVPLSVVVTVVDGGAALRRCLAALAAQEGAPEFEVLVPVDDSVAGLAALRSEFPRVRFLEMGRVPTERPAASPAGQHELFDRRRAAGLAAAAGELVAILEDRSVPRPDWARTAVALHAAPDVVIGGAIENGVDLILNWAVYFCDFGRYQPPFPPGPAAWASDVNVCYKREALARTRPLWQERYHETTVHWALQRAGHRLVVSPALVVEQVRDDLRLRDLLRERFHWGRLFAFTRVRETGSPWRRPAFNAASTLLPLLLYTRLARLQLRRRAAPRRFLQATPAILLLLTAWSLGEFVGYVTGRR